MRLEREPTLLELDPFEIARALRCKHQIRPGEAVDFELRNETLNITLKLNVDATKRTVSIYLRGPSAFLGFVHMLDVEDVRADEERGEVWFLTGNGERLAVQDVGVFLLTSRAVFASGDIAHSP